MVILGPFCFPGYPSRGLQKLRLLPPRRIAGEIAHFRYKRILEEMGGVMVLCALYDRGFCLVPERKKKVFVGGGIRGNIRGSSSASFRRLREFCITHDVPGVRPYGITLTVPGLAILDNSTFKALLHRFLVWCNDNSIPLIWRVELQQRGMPHAHLVVYCSMSDCLRISLHWFRLLNKLPLIASVEFVDSMCKDIVTIPRGFVHGSVHSVDVQALSGSFSSYRYLVAHMSKGKKAQLGWSGRNWGVVCRSSFVSLLPYDITIQYRVYILLLRWLRRLTRRKIRASVGCSYWLSNPSTLRRMIQYATSLYNDCPF